MGSISIYHWLIVLLMIGLPLPRLVGLEMGILVTPGLDKVTATLAAIRGGYVTHLVTGTTVAEALLAAP